jgi:hypothetical protein
MKFDFQWLNWLISLFNKPTGAAPTTQIVASTNYWDGLRLLADHHALRAPMNEMIDFWQKKYPGKQPRYWAIFDATTHSKQRRLKIFDANSRTVSEYYCAHGKNSDPQFTGWVSKFSNEPGSLCTSKGIYRCAETYNSLKFGYAMRLDGLQSTNSNARKRAVVFHGANYAEDKYIKANGKTGRSEGCTAVGFQYSTDLVNKLKQGSPLMVWGK